jgi:hypothetical protein
MAWRPVKTRNPFIWDCLYRPRRETDAEAARPHLCGGFFVFGEDSTASVAYKLLVENMDSHKLPFIRTTLGIALVFIIALVIGFFSGMEYKAYQVRSAIAQTLTQVQSAAQTPQIQTAQDNVPPAGSTYIDNGIGDEVTLATFKYKVLSSKEQVSIQNSLGSSAVAGAGAKFVVVTLDITNLTNSNLLFPTGGIPLVDSQGRQYSDYSGSIGNIDNYLDGTQLPPDIAKEGVEVFEVPTTSTSYYLEAAKGGTNDIYRVKLQ